MENLAFKDWLEKPELKKTDAEIAGMYFYNSELTVKEIASKTNCSIAEIYRILHQYGSPNRQIINHENVLSFASAGMSVNRIAEFTGYTPRNIRYILKNKR